MHMNKRANRQDWHRADIVAELRKRNMSLAELPQITEILSVRLAKRILVQIWRAVLVSTKRGGSGSSAAR